VRPRRRSRVARPSLRVGRSRHPVTVCPDGWSPPRYLLTRNRIRLTGQLARPVLLTRAGLDGEDGTWRYALGSLPELDGVGVLVSRWIAAGWQQLGVSGCACEGVWIPCVVGGVG
jgi:hypothetical protein